MFVKIDNERIINSDYIQCIHLGNEGDIIFVTEKENFYLNFGENYEKRRKVFSQFVNLFNAKGLE